jgi:signal transduction histidine kinase
MMQTSLSDFPGILDRCQTGITAIFRQSAALPKRANGLADLLRELLPETALTACQLGCDSQVCLAIRSRNKQFDSSQEGMLQSQLSSLDPLVSRVLQLPAAALAGLHGLASAIHEGERAWGFLVIALSDEAAAEERAQAEAVLTAAAPAVALRWMLEALQRERAELTRFALVGQAFAGLAHDLNNALNSMMLQTSVVQLRVDPQVRQELMAIRQHGAQAAGLVRSLQHVVQERREQSSEIDLNSVLTELLGEEPELHRRLVLRLGAESPRIHSTRIAVKQLLRLLLEGVCAATKAALCVETTFRDGGAILELRIPSATADLDSESGQAAAVETLLWQNLDEIGRQAGQSLLRQLGGVVTIEREQNGTLHLHVVWRTSP